MLTIDATPEQMRTMVRISHHDLDEELENLKGAFLLDLEICGITQIPPGDPLSLAALRLYLRWQMDYCNDSDRYKSAYNATKIAMSLAREYRGGSIEK